MSKNVLVTGGSGFIGSHVVDFLIEKKYNVTIYDLFLPKRRDVKFIKGSILDKKRLQFALQNIDFVFHLAARSRIQPTISSPGECFEVNVVGTQRALEWSRLSCVRSLNTDHGRMRIGGFPPQGARTCPQGA